MQAFRDAMPRAVAELIRSAPLSTGKAELAWSFAVGRAVQRNTDVRLESGLLIVEASSRQWADEVRRSSRIIMARLQSLLGEAAVNRIEVRIR